MPVHVVRRPDRQRERGAATAAVMSLAIILLLAFGVGFLVRLAPAVGQADELQTAADSAALAGAQQIGKDIEDHVGWFIRHDFQVPDCGAGGVAAQQFAQRNDTTVTSYCYYPVSDQVRVTVRSNTVLADGRRDERSAVASVGFAFTGCWLERPTWETPSPTPTPEPTATPTPGATPTPAPPPPPPPAPGPKRGWVHCRDANDAIPVVVSPDGPVLYVDLPPGQLKKLLTIRPRLVR